MIECLNVTKSFGRVVALDEVSCVLPAGSITALLGGNGAGKTTLLRLLAGLAAPTRGHVRIGGHDTLTEPFPVRRLLGYLSEEVPLYEDMRVGEFLRHRAALKGVSLSDRAERVAAVLNQCGLHDMERRFIGALSKGSRKRVGIADAMVHRPQLLLLDEPVVGLDREHAAEILDLIAGLAGRQTVVFSTHGAGDAEQAGAAKMIIERGRVSESGCGAGSADAKRTLPACIVELRGPREIILLRLKSIANVRDIRIEGDGVWNRFVMEVEAGRDIRPDVFAVASENRWVIRELQLVRPGNEQAPGEEVPRA